MYIRMMRSILSGILLVVIKTQYLGGNHYSDIPETLLLTKHHLTLPRGHP